MSSPDRRGSDLRRVAETLLYAVAGGTTLGLLGLPAGWLSGAILAVSVAALARRPVFIPDALSRLTFLIAGISLGSAVTPETLGSVARWPMSMLFLTLTMVVLTAAVAAYLRLVHRWDPGSALLGSFPGALATVVVLAIESGANVRAIAVVQTVRVVVLAVGLPITLAALGLTGTPTAMRESGLVEPGQLLILVGASAAAAFTAQKLRVPGGLIFGAMVASATLHGTGLITVSLPAPLAVASFIVLGALTGTRFANTDIRTLRHLAAAAAGALVLGTGIALAAAFAGAMLLSLDPGSMVIAYAPGAIDAMMILALALHYDPVFVGAHHLARFMLVLLTMPMVVRLVQRWRAPTGSPPGGPEAK